MQNAVVPIGAVRAVIASLLLAVMTPAAAQASVIAFNLNITATTSNAGFGTGVTAGNVFTGQLFFDTADLTPDGSRARTVLPGGDALTIAGISYDTVLNFTFWRFTFAGGAPLCMGDAGLDGCGNADGQGITLGDGRALQFFDTGTGGAAAPTAEGGQAIDFSYALAAVAIPEPGGLGLMVAGLGGLGLLIGRRRRRTP